MKPRTGMAGWALLIAFVSYRLGWYSGAKQFAAAMHGDKAGPVAWVRDRWHELVGPEKHEEQHEGTIERMTPEELAKRLGAVQRSAEDEEPKGGQYL